MSLVDVMIKDYLGKAVKLETITNVVETISEALVSAKYEHSTSLAIRLLSAVVCKQKGFGKGTQIELESYLWVQVQDFLNNRR